MLLNNATAILKNESWGKGQNWCITCHDQTIKIQDDGPTIQMSIDGRMSVGNHPTQLIWAGAHKGDLSSCTQVEIRQKDGECVLSGGVNQCFNLIREEEGQTLFDLL